MQPKSFAGKESRTGQCATQNKGLLAAGNINIHRAKTDRKITYLTDTICSHDFRHQPHLQKVQTMMQLQ